jgi:hypothetical protein
MAQLDALNMYLTLCSGSGQWVAAMKALVAASGPVGSPSFNPVVGCCGAAAFKCVLKSEQWSLALQLAKYIGLHQVHEEEFQTLWTQCEGTSSAAAVDGFGSLLSKYVRGLDGANLKSQPPSRNRTVQAVVEKATLNALLSEQHRSALQNWSTVTIQGSSVNENLNSPSASASTFDPKEDSTPAHAYTVNQRLATVLRMAALPGSRPRWLQALEYWDTVPLSSRSTVGVNTILSIFRKDAHPEGMRQFLTSELMRSSGGQLNESSAYVVAETAQMGNSFALARMLLDRTLFDVSSVDSPRVLIPALEPFFRGGSSQGWSLALKLAADCSCTAKTWKVTRNLAMNIVRAQPHQWLLAMELINRAEEKDSMKVAPLQVACLRVIGRWADAFSLIGNLQPSERAVMIECINQLRRGADLPEPIRQHLNRAVNEAPSYSRGMEGRDRGHFRSAPQEFRSGTQERPIQHEWRGREQGGRGGQDDSSRGRGSFNRGRGGGSNRGQGGHWRRGRSNYRGADRR